MKNKILLPAALIAALGGFLFGFDTAVISGTTERLREIFELDAFWLGFTVASAIIGTVLGAMFAGKPADRWGRRNTLFILALLYLVSAVGSALAWDWSFIFSFQIDWRTRCGGLISCCSDVYCRDLSCRNKGQNGSPDSV